MASNPKTVAPIKSADNDNPLSKLREPFAPNHISKLPKPTKRQTDDVRADFKKGIRCQECGSWHHPDVIHLDYVGHAAATDRLLDTDIEWFWEPLAVNDKGLPAFDENGGLWIKLTVCGVTRLGYGSADGKSGGDAKKEIIGDAIRNAGMRFGMALDLWHKGDLHADSDAQADQSAAASDQTRQREPVAETTQRMIQGINACTSLKALYEWRALNGEAVNSSADKKRLVALFKQRTEAMGEGQQPETTSPQSSEILADEIPY